MIPLRDENRSSAFAWVTILVVLINLAVFGYQAWWGPRGYEGYLLAFGMIPGELTRQVQVHIAGRLDPALSIFTAMFMHGGLLHLVSNMWFLWIFGDNIEHELGGLRYLTFYLVTGAISFLTHTVLHPGSTIPLVGASGAIAGILGAYFVLFPRHRILTLVPIFFYITVVRIPAAFFLGLWFVMQLLYSQMGGQVAWYAHIGGFLAGVVLIRFFLRSGTHA